MLKRYVQGTLLMLATATLLLAGCGSPEAAPAPTTASAQQSAEDQSMALRIAVLPIIDVLPLHVAAQNGYYDQLGLEIELVPVKSGQERDTLMQTGQVDGMLTDLLSPVLFNQEDQKLVVVRTARKVYPNAPLFRLLAKPGSDAEKPTDLAGVAIGSAQNTVIAYITDRMLENSGLSGDQIVMQEVGAIPVRFELLINGELDAATLPDPLASGAIAAGAVLVVDDTAVPDLSQSILVFSTASLEAKETAVRSLLKAWEMAIAELNANPESYHDLLIKEGRVPESVQGTFQMPPFPEASVPTPQQLADMVEWALLEGLIDNSVPYERMVDDSYLP